MPKKPIARPRVREPVGRSPSQPQATSAPNKGTVAFRMADRPVLIDSSANANSRKGNPELMMPTRNTAF